MGQDVSVVGDEEGVTMDTQLGGEGEGLILITHSTQTTLYMCLKVEERGGLRRGGGEVKERWRWRRGGGHTM